MTVGEYIKDNPDITIAKVTVLGAGEVPLDDAMEKHIIMSCHNDMEDRSIVELTVC